MTPPETLQRGTSAVVIAQTIRNDICAGRLPHGRQLPSTRDLAGEWDTSVATINRAMAILADEGLVLNRARSSRIVNYPPPPTEGERHRPTVILIGGYAGSGKTELGRVVTRRTGWAILDKDTTTRPVVEAALEKLGLSPHDRESKTYLETIRPAEYEALFSTMVENIECGASVVVTAPFVQELHDDAWCQRISATIREAGGELHVVWVRCDAESMLAYIRRRGAARDASKLANWSDYLAQVVDLDYTPALPHTIIDNSQGSQTLQDQANALLTGVRS